MRGWRIWIDQGGTFTDLVAQDPEGQLKVRKLLSDAPHVYRHAPLQGIRDLLGLGRDQAIPEDVLEAVRMGTTKGTNALLERRGEPFPLLVTEGFEDLLSIGYQDRPELFALRIVKPETLPRKVVGIPERIDSDGRVETPLDRERAGDALRRLRAEGFTTLAVLFLHSWKNPDHELAVEARARDLGFEWVSVSHRVANEIKAVGRGDTTTVDAYLSPVLRRYLTALESELPRSTRLFMMQSSGGLASVDRFSGKDSVLSGPAGGVVAVAHVARRAGFEKVLGFDMGGTSTDVSRFDGEFARVYETKVAGIRLKAPMLEVSTVAAGGGSILRFEQGRFQVGPESAGADPGPACYGRGGPLAVTDANLVLGRIRPEHFPQCFGPSGTAALDLEAARRGFAAVVDAVRVATGRKMTIEEVAEGFVRIANENMADPIVGLSQERGHDVRDHALLGFGGAAGQHVTAIARSLSIRTVLLHPLSGVLSAFGIGLADLVAVETATRPGPLDEGTGERLASTFAELSAQVRRALLDQGAAEGDVTVVATVDLRYRGVDQTLNVAWDADLGRLRAAFESAHQRLYGFLHVDVPVEVVTVRVLGTGRTPDPDLGSMAPPARAAGSPPPTPVGRGPVWFPSPQGGVTSVDSPFYRREDLAAGDRIEGPALVIEAISTIVLAPGWTARLSESGVLVLEDAEGRPPEPRSTRRDPIRLELWNNLFMSCAETMGRTLERVSHSTNIKERLDFSCALFTKAGELVANAPHIPVHLGAMGATVAAVRDEVGDRMRPGDVFVSNDPYHGGSHLPDVTVVTPVFDDAGKLRAFVANRGHHADIGGISPGSMPPFSRSIDEEGVRLHAFPLVEGGRFREAEIRARLSEGRWPARNPEERLSDLRAQVAANQAGVRRILELDRLHGPEVVDAYMGHVLDNGEEAVREVLADLPAGEHRAFDFLDDGARIGLTVKVDGERAVFDFTGTDPQLPGNLNAPVAVVHAAVLYALRCLTRRTLPLNGGCLRPVSIVIPEGSLLSPRPPAAVVGGNVETSQRVVDVVFGAVRKVAASQGTMNNLTFGNDSFGYYETICGGAGAGLGFDGASAVHTHMTNTRLTDPEVMELRYPVRVRRFSIRAGSGGAGTYRGGDGVVREIEFRKPVTVSILSERRALGPFGLGGAEPGRAGRNALRRKDRWIELPAKVRIEAEAGDRIRIETPGGGGYEPDALEWARMRPDELRRLCRLGRFTRPTPGIATGHVQANLIVLPAAAADAFEAFCRANAQACPLLERLPDGDPMTRILAAGADLRTDLPRYLVHRPEGVEAVADLAGIWGPGCAAFLLGCSFTFESGLLEAGIGLRHVEEGRNVPMYRTGQDLVPVGPFGGKLVVSMRPVASGRVEEARRITGRWSRAHGAPVHAGDPASLAIAKLAAPEFGDAVTVRHGEVPVFWACGVSSQEACRTALATGAIPWFASHAPGHMFVADLTDRDLLDPEPARS